MLAGAAYHEVVVARWRSSYVLKLAVWWVGYAALVQLLPGAHSGWELAAIFVSAVTATTLVMTLIADGPRSLVRIVRPSARGSETN